MEYSVNWII